MNRGDLTAARQALRRRRKLRKKRGSGIPYNSILSLPLAHGDVPQGRVRNPTSGREEEMTGLQYAQVFPNINIQNVKGEAKPYQMRQLLSLMEKYNLKLSGDNENE